MNANGRRVCRWHSSFRWLQMVLRTGRLSLEKMIGFRRWPRIGKSGPGGAQGLNVNRPWRRPGPECS